MCSIFGMVNWSKPSPQFVTNAFNLMRHRGPDSESTFTTGDLTLGHQRLKILDLSNNANQPFEHNSDLIVFNGEIYNYKELAKEFLQDYPLRTTSDTEVLAILLSRFKLSILNSLNGMFSVAWYESKSQQLTLFRDRFGVKPLYYMRHEGNFYFSSELKPLLKQKHSYTLNKGPFENFINRTISDYDEQTGIEDIFQLKHGHYLTIDLRTQFISEQKRWYQFNDYPQRNSYSNFKGFVNRLEELLTDSIKLRLRSDIEVGLTLSGGLDSSTIYTLAKENLGAKLKCFTVSHLDAPTDESHLVKKLTSEYGDELIILEDSGKYSLDQLRDSLSNVEFPVWNSSCLAYDAIYREIKKHNIRVIIEGHGSDEQLGGYPYMIQLAYFTLLKEKKFLHALKTRKVYQEVLNKNLNEHFYSQKNWFWHEFIKPPLKKIRRGTSGLEQYDFNSAMKQSFDTNIIPLAMRGFDRFTMKNTIESRSPFMDYRIVEFLRGAPIEYKVTSIGSKAPLRTILKKYNKDYIYKTKAKMGFAGNCPEFYTEPNLSKIRNIIDNGIVKSLYPDLYLEATEKLNLPSVRWDTMERIWKALSVSLIKDVYDDIVK